MTIGATLEQPGVDVPEAVAAKLTVAQIIAWVLKERRMTDALILKLYYLDSLTMYEIGQAFGQSESNISQRHKFLLAAVRGRFAAAA